MLLSPPQNHRNLTLRLRYINVFLAAVLTTLQVSAIKANEETAKCNIALNGIVVDEQMQGLAFANIQFGGRRYLSDQFGKFTISKLCQGTYTLQCAHLSCGNHTQLIELHRDTQIVVQPHQHTEQLPTIEIVAYEATPSTQSVRLSAKNNDAVLNGTVLKQLAGVQLLQSGPSIYKPILNGLHSSRLVLLQGETRFESQSWGLEHAPELDLMQFQRINVIRGAATLKYASDAAAGLIQFENETRNTQKLYGQSALVFNSNGLGGKLQQVLGGNVEKWGHWHWQLHASGKRLGSLSTPDYQLANTASQESNVGWVVVHRFKNWRSKLSYNLISNRSGILQAAHFGNLTDLQRAIESDSPALQPAFSYDINFPNMRSQHEFLSFETTWKANDHNTFNLHLARQYNLREEFDHQQWRNRNSNNPNPDLGLELTTYQLNAHHTYQFNTSLNLTQGIMLSAAANTIHGRFLIPNYSRQQLAWYQFAKWNPAAAHRFEVGYRIETIDQRAFFNQSNEASTAQGNFQNLAIVVQHQLALGNYQKITTQLSRQQRAPHVSELYSNGLHHGAVSIEIGNANLKAETGYQWLTQYAARQEKWSLQAEVYAHLIENYIALQPTAEATLTIRGAFPTFAYRSTDALLNGANFNASFSLLPALELSLAHHLIWARSLSENEWIDLTPPWQHRLTAQFQPKKWQATAQYAQLELEHTQTQSRYSNRDLMAPPPAFTLVNARFGRAIQLGNNTLQLQLAVHNALNTRYRAYTNRFRYFADEPGRNFSIQIQYQF